MPDASAIWLLASPLDGSAPEDQAKELSQRLGDAGHEASIAGMTVPKPTGTKLGQLGRISLPELKTGTLSSLIGVSDACSKHDSSFTSTIAKIVDTVRSLDPDGAERHLVIDDGRPYEDYLLGDWQWNRAKYRVDNRPLSELVDAFVKDMNSLDNSHKSKLGAYNATKSQLQSLQRKKAGNLSTRDLSTVLDSSSAASDLAESEYLENVYVAVPKNNIKDWKAKYERLTQMVVPRSAVEVASDDEFTLFVVSIFRRVKDEFSQRCREEKFTVRDFKFDETAVVKQRKEQEQLERQEKDQWADLLRLSRINFSEAVQLLIHLKVVRAFVECVLRYGLPAHYFFAFVKPDPKQAKKLVAALSDYFEPFTPAQGGQKKKGKGDSDGVGEFQSVLDEELFRFVLYETPTLDAFSSRSS